MAFRLQQVLLVWLLFSAGPAFSSREHFETEENYEEYPQDENSQALLATQPLDGEIPKQHLELWTTADDFRNPLFDMVRGIVRRLDVQLLAFEPSYFIEDGVELGCRLVDPDTMVEQFNPNRQDCTENCTNTGRYCAASNPRSQELVGKVTGREILEESLRRLCVWVVYGKVGANNAFHFFRYINDELFLHCPEPFSKTCTYTVMENVEISPHFIERCMNHTSGEDDNSGLDTDETNSYLMQELDKLHGLTLDMIPAIKIGKNLYTGPETTKDIFRALCSSYPANKQPIACDFCKGCSDVRFCLWNLNCDGTTFDVYAANKMTGTTNTAAVAPPSTAIQPDTTVSSTNSPTASNPGTSSSPAPAAVEPETSSADNDSDNLQPGPNQQNDKTQSEARKAILSGLVLGLVIGMIISGVFACRDWQAKLVLFEINKEEHAGIELKGDRVGASTNNNDVNGQSITNGENPLDPNTKYTDDPSSQYSDDPDLTGS